MLWIVVGLAGVVGLADCSGTRSQAHGKESQVVTDTVTDFSGHLRT